MSDQLQVTIASLPESVATQTIDAIGQRRGKIDNLTRIEALKFEEAKIQEERMEIAKPAPKIADDVLVDTAPVLVDKTLPLA